MNALRWLARLPVRALIFLIELYRSYISPMRMPTCRFSPTCSEYAVTALRTRGLVMGSALTVIRLAKCAPWHPGGWDPVPEPRHIEDEGASQRRRSGGRPEERCADRVHDHSVHDHVHAASGETCCMEAHNS